MTPKGTPANLRPPFEKGNPGGPGRPPEPWKQWLTSLEPEVRERWLKTFRRASPSLRVRMMSELFDRLHCKRTQTVDVGGDVSLKINISGK
jgi:hypothetical protein